MSPDLRTWIAIIGIGATGVITRCSFLLLGERLVLPPSIERALRLAPAAALAATVAPTIVVMDHGVSGAIANPRLGAAIAAVAVMWLSRQMLWSMTAGIAVYTAIRLAVAG